jgi:hypothetical protein
MILEIGKREKSRVNVVEWKSKREEVLRTPRTRSSRKLEDSRPNRWAMDSANAVVWVSVVLMG